MYNFFPLTYICAELGRSLIIIAACFLERFPTPTICQLAPPVIIILCTSRRHRHRFELNNILKMNDEEDIAAGMSSIMLREAGNIIILYDTSLWTSI